MQIFNTISQLTTFLNENKTKNIGFVPTMGALHDGHLSLVSASIDLCDITICSVFVNPKQFNSAGDLANYPRTIEKDSFLLKNQKCDVLFYPNIDEMYEEGENVKEYNFGSIVKIMEGEYRPGHFNGVATIVEKFFSIINPTKAFFGEKDLQQLAIIKKLVLKMNSSIQIIGMPTVREENGLAKSSRNNLLSKKDKKTASTIYSYLIYCKKNKSKGINYLRKDITYKISKQKEFELEYLEFVCLEKMQRIKHWKDEKKSAVCIALFIGGIRLIDNIIL